MLVKRLKKTNKLDTTFNPITHRVVQKRGPDTLVEDLQTNKLYRRNVAHLKKLDDGMAESALNDNVSDVITESVPKDVPQVGPRRSKRLKKI